MSVKNLVPESKAVGGVVLAAFLQPALCPKQFELRSNHNPSQPFLHHVSSPSILHPECAMHTSLLADEVRAGLAVISGLRELFSACMLGNFSQPSIVPNTKRKRTTREKALFVSLLPSQSLFGLATSSVWRNKVAVV